MKKEDRVFEAVMNINRISNSSRGSFKSRIDGIIKEVAACFNTEQASFMIVKGRKTLEVVSATNPALVGVRQALDHKTPSSWVVKNKKMFYSKDPESDTRFERRFDHYKKDAFLLVPVLCDNRVLGVLSVTDRMDADRFSRQDQEVLLSIAGNVISALENKRLAESLKKKKQALSESNRQLKKLEKLRTELFNMLIHDLKGPISEVIANLDILSYVLDNEHLEYVEQAQSGCDILYRMVADLLDITRMEAGSMSIIEERMTPYGFIHEAVSNLTGLARKKSIDIVKPAAAEDEVVFGADKGLLIRVIHNLLVNAIHHSPKGERIEAGYEISDPSHIRFFVSDSGPGIAKEFQSSIFEKFVQIQRKKDGRRYTTGLGLTYCKMAVELHGGSIWVESDGKKGSCFSFTLPLAASQ
ncbi:MAG TPA: GAF domain-containing sensor histidine kinase [Deltaproteobacteria bacterium]|nr:GAF domain-containing sensor histidine kinase [Deltaproteobacteria bacterium]